MAYIVQDNIIYGSSEAKHITTQVGTGTLNLKNTIEYLLTNIANIEEGISTHEYEVGDFLTWNGKLYKVIDDIDIDDQLALNVNIQETNIGEWLKDLKTNVNSAIRNISRSDNSTTFTATKVDGNTFTFTQQDNDTTYTTTSPIILTGTNIGHQGYFQIAPGQQGDSNSVTPGFGQTFQVVTPVINETGHVTAVSTHTVTVPSAVVSANAAGLMTSAYKTQLDAMGNIVNVNYTVVKTF